MWQKSVGTSQALLIETVSFCSFRRLSRILNENEAKKKTCVAYEATNAMFVFKTYMFQSLLICV